MLALMNFRQQFVGDSYVSLRAGQTSDDPIYAWLPGTQTYVRVTDELLAEIHQGKHRY